MIISEMIKMLEFLKEQHGDIPVITYMSNSLGNPEKIEIEQKNMIVCGGVKYQCSENNSNYDETDGYTKGPCILID